LTPEEMLKKQSDEFQAGVNEIREKLEVVDKLKLHQETKDKEVNETIQKVQETLDKQEVELRELKARQGASKDEQSPEHKDFVKWLRTGIKSEELEKKTAYRTSDDTAGGYTLAPPTVAAEILTTITESSPIRQIASVMTIGTESVEWIRQTAAFSANWAGETANREEANQMKFGRERIPVHEAGCYLDITNQMLEDASFDIEGFINRQFGERFGVLEANAFVNGNTTYAPQGILADGNIANTAGGDANNVTADGLITLYFSPKTAYLANARWVMARATMAYIAKLKDGDNNYLLRRLGESPVWSILGAPVVEAYHMPAMANAAFPVLFGDFRRGYQIVDRVGLAVLRDPYSAANQSAIRFHARKRVGGKVIQPEAIYKMRMTAS